MKTEFGHVDPVRSRIMKAVRQRNTTPEMVVRRSLHASGFRFRLHRKDLPGSPDIVLSRHRTVIFVHGCFWHRHPHCPKATTPKTRLDFWSSKFLQNVERDRRNEKALKDLGWRVFLVWECETKQAETLRRKLDKAFL